MEELKPCPFCGGYAKEFTGYDAKPYRWTVECESCGAHVGEETRYKARVKWNRRADECDREALLSVCAEIEDADVDGCIDWADRIRKVIGEVPDDAPMA